MPTLTPPWMFLGRVPLATAPVLWAMWTPLSFQSLSFQASGRGFHGDGHCEKPSAPPTQGAGRRDQMVGNPTSKTLDLQICCSYKFCQKERFFPKLKVPFEKTGGLCCFVQQREWTHFLLFILCILRILFALCVPKVPFDKASPMLTGVHLTVSAHVV